MYINPIVAGVLGTLMAEFILLFAWAILAKGGK